MLLLNKLSDFIHCFENILDLSICDQIVNDSEKETFYSAGVQKTSNKNDARNCYYKRLNKKYNSFVYKAIHTALSKYIKQHEFFQTGLSIEDTGYDHLLYKGDQKGEYKMHVDHVDISPRVLSISLILNDNYEGGNFSFFKDNPFIIKKKKGSVIIFPSNFCFPHAVTPVTNGDRHSIITWIH